jgi:hypothetical protein
MNRVVLIARSLVSVLGLALIVLGVLLWSGRALGLLSLHMLLGTLFVISLWALVAVALIARAARGLALVVLLWSLVVPALGVEQVRLLPGSQHWVIQSSHLLVGLIAIGLGHALARRIPRTAAAPAAIAE